jgi:hypothetical protein
MAYRIFGYWVCAAALIGPAVMAQPAGELVSLINAYRSAPQDCEGKASAVAGPLAPDSRLAGVKIEAGNPLQDALKARGHPWRKCRLSRCGGLPARVPP